MIKSEDKRILLNYNIITTSIYLNENGLPNFVIQQEKNSSNSYFIIASLSHYNSAINFNDDNQNIEVGDCLLSINGRSICNESSLANVLALLKGAPRSQFYLVLQRVSFDKEESFRIEKSKQLGILTKNQCNVNGIYSNKQNLNEKPSPKQRLNIDQTKEKLETVADLEFGDKRLDGLVEVFNFLKVFRQFNCFKEICLIRDLNNALGLSIVGGIDHCSHPFGTNSPGVFISKIADNSSASFSRRLRVGDRILKVNDKDVEKAKHSEAVEVLFLYILFVYKLVNFFNYKKILIKNF